MHDAEELLERVERGDIDWPWHAIAMSLAGEVAGLRVRPDLHGDAELMRRDALGAVFDAHATVELWSMPMARDGMSVDDPRAFG